MGSRIQNLPSLFSILGSSITWRESHSSGRFAEAVRSFQFEMHVLPFLLQTSDLKLLPAIGAVPLTYSQGCPVLLKKCTAVKFLAFLPVRRECLSKMYYLIPRNLYYVKVHWDQLPKIQRTPPDWTKHVLTFCKLLFCVKKINSRNFIFPPLFFIDYCCLRQFIKNVCSAQRAQLASKQAWCGFA